MTTSPRVITVATFKGGVGKTTVVTNLAAAFAVQHPGSRGLLVDLDPQGNLTSSVDNHFGSAGTTNSGAVLSAALDDTSFRVNPDDFTGLDFKVDLLPAGGDLTRVEERLLTEVGGERVLKRAIQSLGYDWILIDTRPSDGRLTLNAVCAASEVIAVVNPARWASEGAARVQGFVNRVRDMGLTDAAFAGTVMNKVEGGRRVLRDQVFIDLQDSGVTLLTPSIPLRGVVAEGEYVGSPVVLGEPTSPVTKAFLQLATTLWPQAKVRSA